MKKERLSPLLMVSYRMKTIILICLGIIFSAQNLYATPISIKINCKDTTYPLFLLDGDFANETQLRLSSNIKSTSDLRKYLKNKFSEDRQFQDWSDSLSELELLIKSNIRLKLRDVHINDLLIDRSVSCQHKAIIEWSPDTGYMISQEFDLLSRQDKIYYLFEAISFKFTNNYSNISHRNFVYNMLSADFLTKNDKDIIAFRVAAGLDYIYKYGAKVDLSKEISFEREQIRIAYLEKDSAVVTPNGICRASARKPALFSDGILSVFTLKENCPLFIGDELFHAKIQTQIKLRNYGFFVNEPLPTFIESIYVTNDTIISNKNVELKASKDPDLKSKLHFKLDASEKIEAYTQFTGKVNFFGTFIRIKDHTNMAIQFNLENITMMVLDEEIEFTQGGFTNKYTGHIQLSSSNEILRGIITGANPKVKNRNRVLILQSNSPISFYDSGVSSEQQILSATLGKSIILQANDFNEYKFQAGDILFFTPSGYVNI